MCVCVCVCVCVKDIASSLVYLLLFIETMSVSKDVAVATVDKEQDDDDEEKSDETPPLADGDTSLADPEMSPPRLKW